MKTDFEKALEKHNEILYDYYWEDGTEEDSIVISKERLNNWNLRDLVADMDYRLSKFYTKGNMNDYNRGVSPDTWIAATTKMKRFIKRWLPKSKEMKPFEKT